MPSIGTVSLLRALVDIDFSQVPIVDEFVTRKAWGVPLDEELKDFMFLNYGMVYVPGPHLDANPDDKAIVLVQYSHTCECIGVNFADFGTPEAALTYMFEWVRKWVAAPADGIVVGMFTYPTLPAS